MGVLARTSAPCLVASALLLSACGAVPTSSTPTPPVEAKPAAPRYNLAGYSASFKQGYADACATPRRRNAERFKAETDYSMGWQDGQSACRR